MKKIFVILLFAIISTSLYSQRRGWVPWQMKLYFLDSIYFVKEPLIGLDTAATRGFVRSLSGTGSMVYPDAGIALSSGGAWGASITNNSANWNTAYGWGDHSIAGYAPADSPNFTGTVTLPSATSIGDVSSTEIGYVDNVTSNIQTQLNARGRVATITTNILAGEVTDVTLTGVTAEPYSLYIIDADGLNITDAVKDSTAISGGVYHTYIYSVDAKTNAKIRVLW